MRTIFRFFRGILRMAWSLFWGFFWTIAISFLVLVGIIYFTDSPSSGMDGFGRAAQKVVYQVGNLFGDQGFASRFGMTPSSQTTQTDNHGQGVAGIVVATQNQFAEKHGSYKSSQPIE